MTKEEVLAEIQAYGSETTKRTLMKHGAREPLYGAKVEDLKKIQKKIKNDHELALELYDSGVSDAMYLAGLIADGTKMTKEQLGKWAETASWSMISEYSVPWVAAESPFSWELAMEWIASADEKVASAGWATLSGIVALRPDIELDMEQLRALLERVERDINTAPNRVRYVMNGFVIAVGSYVAELSDEAGQTGERIGNVMVDMGGTSCKVPYAPDYIQKVIDKGKLGKKKKTLKC